MKMKSYLMLCLVVPLFSFAQTQVGGGIFTPTIWELAGSPYQVTSDVVIFPDQSASTMENLVVMDLSKEVTSNPAVQKQC